MGILHHKLIDIYGYFMYDIQCQCAAVAEGDEEDEVSTGFRYAKECGVVLRLWSYPTSQSIETDIPANQEEGFFCYLERYDKKQYDTSLCDIIKKYAAVDWLKLKDSEMAKYRGAKAAACKAWMSQIYLTESCVRTELRTMAQEQVVSALEDIIRDKRNSSESLCLKISSAEKGHTKPHMLVVFDEDTLIAEREAWLDPDQKSSKHKAIAPLILDLLDKADSGMKLGPYSVLDKAKPPVLDHERIMYRATDSVRPYFWPFYLVPKNLLEGLKLNSSKAVLADGMVHRDGLRVPGSIVGGPGEKYNDRSSAWYFMGNVSTLALAWFFTKQTKYAKYAVVLLDSYILSNETGMHPNLMFAQEGESSGLTDWKDLYFLLDAVVLLERSGAMSREQMKTMNHWCSQLKEWYLTSDEGISGAYRDNNHAMYFDLIVLALSVYTNDIENMDSTRSRLHFRLASPWPLGHYNDEGIPVHESQRPTALHYITFNLNGWIYNALIVDKLSKSNILPGAFPSLWDVKHYSGQKQGNN
jgi:hypothetical protein